MKQILFVAPNIQIGGVLRALANLPDTCQTDRLGKIICFAFLKAIRGMSNLMLLLPEYASKLLVFQNCFNPAGTCELVKPIQRLIRMMCLTLLQLVGLTIGASASMKFYNYAHV